MLLRNYTVQEGLYPSCTNFKGTAKVYNTMYSVNLSIKQYTFYTMYAGLYICTALRT